MRRADPVYATPTDHLAAQQPDHPVLHFAPSVLQDTAAAFRAGFKGLVTYAVKANDRPEILSNLAAAGIGTFDVASPAEMARVRAVSSTAVLHYNNPVRSEVEISAALKYDVASWSIDDPDELAKLNAVPRSAEVAVRFRLPVAGAAYDFGTKFGATPDAAAALLRDVAAMGFRPSLCFHPGTQCEDAQAWVKYVEAAAEICRVAGVRIGRLNIGGGFAADRGQGRPDHIAVFTAVEQAVACAFGAEAPELLCEPGRAMVAPSCVLSTRIKAMRDGGAAVYLNDGIYGGLVDLRDMGLSGLVKVISPVGTARTGDPRPRIAFGPTCDSLDRLPDGLALPMDAASGDYVLFGGMGAYSIAMSTAFNGYGLHEMVMVAALED